MKSIVFVASLLASLAAAQPHGHGHGHQHRRKEHEHHERGLAVTWVTETVYETVTAIVDDSTTELIMPSTKPATTTSSTPGPSPGMFFPGPDTSSTTSTTPTQAPPVVQPPPPPPPPPAPAPSPSTTSVAAPPVDTPPPSSGGSPTYSGDITYFALGMGSCGIDDSLLDRTHNVVAVSAQLMGAQSNGNPMCGKTITIQANGKTITAVVHDKCPSCAPGDIDGSEKMFVDLFGALTDGRRKIEWWFNE
ncbi:RlpA-like double-psi beta-barrel-protein domain-containing protein-containing protein [Parachaetomium inaequale]|uniref:RlpA-like double-psi beta-barrel-protein domain-containing protein-containing protein n=1 Tax=Parachaetomium inaequale TaxID=2588326 RepID=A0AAN6SQI5_9PEZI|nr:RlpA-like double-psi beta-barrel-protein domain-containing protein-containing protein [Parachaetomium inaequale]